MKEAELFGVLLPFYVFFKGELAVSVEIIKVTKSYLGGFMYEIEG